MRQLGFSFIADSGEADMIKRELHNRLPALTVNIMPGYENIEPKRYSVTVSAAESITKAVAIIDTAQDIVFKTRQEARKNGTV